MITRMKVELNNKSKLITSLQGKLRDTQKSREEWKTQATQAQVKLAELTKENENLKKTLKKRWA